MQCMLPRAEYELYYAGESASLTTDAPLALTCPYCGRMGLTEAALYEHACCEHSDLAVEVVSIIPYFMIIVAVLYGIHVEPRVHGWT